MKPLKTLLLSKTLVAAALAATGLAAPATSHAISAAGGPDDGVACRSGYVGFLDGSRFKCKKNTSVILPLACLSPNFPTYVNRASGAPFDTSGGLDICTRATGTPGAINLGPTDSLQGLALSTNGTTGVYEFAKVNPAQITNRIANADAAEASALGQDPSQVDTVQSINFNMLNSGVGGIKDQHAVQLIMYTFAVPAGAPIVIGNPGPVSSSTPFVPRPLP